MTEEEHKKQIYSQKSLRTLEGDIQEAIQERNTSAASMVMAEQAKTVASISQPRERRPSNFNKKLFIIIASIILVTLGLGGAYYLYMQSPLAPSAPAIPKAAAIPSIVAPDAQKTLDLSGLGQNAARTAVKNALSNVGNGNGSILQIIPVQKGTNGSLNIINATDFIPLLDLPAPNVLSRSLNNQWMLGTYNDNGDSAPFIILTDNFFQNAYAGMIAWESTISDDFANVFGYSNMTASGGGTSTLASYFNIQGSWKDGVIQNKDVRAFTKPDGAVLILYSFVDNNTIVITTDGKALSEIINRLEKQTFIR